MRFYLTPTHCLAIADKQPAPYLAHAFRIFRVKTGTVPALEQRTVSPEFLNSFAHELPQKQAQRDFPEMFRRLKSRRLL